MSMKHIRDGVRKGNTILAWQVGEGIVGLCKTASGGYKEDEQFGRYNMFDLAESPCVEWAATPISIAGMRQSPILSQMDALRMPLGTVFAVTRHEWTEIRRLIKRHKLATDTQLHWFAT